MLDPKVVRSGPAIGGLNRNAQDVEEHLEDRTYSYSRYKINPAEYLPPTRDYVTAYFPARCLDAHLQNLAICGSWSRKSIVEYESANSILSWAL